MLRSSIYCDHVSQVMCLVKPLIESTVRVALHNSVSTQEYMVQQSGHALGSGSEDIQDRVLADTANSAISIQLSNKVIF